MFSALFPERLSSTWRLGILIGLLLVGSVVMCVLMAGLALRQDLSSIASAVVLDDLGEYSVLYNRDGIEGIRSVFAAGKHEQDQGIRISTSQGGVIFQDMPAAMRLRYDWPTRPPTGLQKNGVLFFNLKNSSDDEMLVGCKLLSDGNVLWFCRTNDEDRAYVKHISGNLWLAGLGAAVLALLPLVWFARQVLQPVQEMMNSAQTLAQGSTNKRMVSPAAVPELQAFAAAYNHGLARIESLTSELQSANDNLAHELRTPLARIRGNLEAYHDTTDNAAAKEAAARGLDEIDRATQLVQTILTIRAGDHQALKLHLEPVDLRALLHDLHDLYQPAAEQRGLRLSLDAEQGIVLSLDQQRITQAVANFLDNAFSYTPSGGSVTLALTTTENTARIIVRDTGPGVRDDEKERIWQRHARGSAASALTPGMGLGLSLVRAIAIAHGGSAGCAPRDDGGAEFWIELPMTRTV